MNYYILQTLSDTNDHSFLDDIRYIRTNEKIYKRYRDKLLNLIHYLKSVNIYVGSPNLSLIFYLWYSIFSLIILSIERELPH